MDVDEALKGAAAAIRRMYGEAEWELAALQAAAREARGYDWGDQMSPELLVVCVTRPETYAYVGSHWGGTRSGCVLAAGNAVRAAARKLAAAPVG